MLEKRTSAASMNAKSRTRVAAGTRASAVDCCAALASCRKRTMSSPGIAAGAAAMAAGIESARASAARNTRFRGVRDTGNLLDVGRKALWEPGGCERLGKVTRLQARSGPGGAQWEFWVVGRNGTEVVPPASRGATGA